MFCQNCGNKLNGNEDFCPNCGNRIKQPEVPSTNSIIRENLTKQAILEKLKLMGKFLKPILSKMKNFILKYQKQFMITSVCCLVVMIGFLLFYHFYDFTKMSWDKENGDANVTYTESTTLKLNVLAHDKEGNPITDITFKIEAGEMEADGASVQWTLPTQVGEYTIVAVAPSGKTIKKIVHVIHAKENSNTLAGMIQIPEEENADHDQDGLTNVEERALGTNVESADTDGDGINDYYEIYMTKTDPLKKDTDGDGVNDGDELDLGLDPLKKDSKEDGVNDGERQLTYTIENDKLGVLLEINGKGNIASSTIDVLTNSTFANMDGILDKVFQFYSTGTIESAKVKINYTLEEIQAKGLNEDHLTLYYFNEDSKNLEPLETMVDKEKKQIVVTLPHFLKYVIGDSEVVFTNYETEIMFVIDNSVSMYSEAQMIEAGYESSTGAVGNDISFKRLTLTNNMVDMFTGNYKFGVAEFSGDYVTLKTFTDGVSEVKKAVNSMKSNWNSNAVGTNIVSALKSGIAEFSSSNENGHYLILLTDGKNTEGSLSYNKNTIINNAKNSKVKVCVIGLGSEIDTDDLNEIAEATGCDYYSASDASALDEIYSMIGADINYNYVDTDGDNKVDGMIHANSGFLVNRDGFSFQNFRSNKSEGGHCYGMATFAMLYYKNQLPSSLPAKDNSRFYLRYFQTLDLSSNGYDLSNTYFTKGNNKLYDYKITNKALNLFLTDKPSDYRDRVENDTWMIKKEYYDMMSKIGATFSVKKYTSGNPDFTQYQSALLNIDSDPFNTVVVKDESQMINAIWRLFILQADEDSTDFSSAPDQAFAELKQHLSEGTPMVIAIAGNHAVNAIRLIQDINDANHFKIEIYDNNYPGETRYIDVIRSKYSIFQLSFLRSNEYNYQFMYDTDDDGIAEDISVQLSYPEIN